MSNASLTFKKWWGEYPRTISENQMYSMALVAWHDEQIREMREGQYRIWLEYRGVKTPCSKCGGLGVRAYGNTSTWRGGIGGQMITSGICDNCWGSGSADYPWLDLRKLRAKMGDIT